MDKPKAVVLLSGGLDSTTALAIARDAGFQTFALTFDYGQKHRTEIDSARKVAAKSGAEQHRIVAFDLAAFGGSSLTCSQLDVPQGRARSDMAAGIPNTYVPARNTIFLSFALAWAEVIGSNDIYVGVNALDYSGYPDCRPEYIEAFQNMANLATKRGVEGKGKVAIRTPLIALGKAQIIVLGQSLGVDFSQTTSCYLADDRGACGACDSCLLRSQGFAQVGMVDPTTYREICK